MRSIYSFSYPELEQEMLALGQTRYRAKQIYAWLYKRTVASFDEMTDISKAFREELKSRYDFYVPECTLRQESKDGTIKSLFRMKDGEEVESVLMHYVYGYAVCISSQVGCNMNCAFCASGLLRKKRNLSPEEMMGQVLSYDRLLKQRDPALRVSHVVVMGTGEPFDNYDNVLSFLRNVNSPFGLDIGARHITVSTCGIVPGILRFGKEGLQVNLAISLHAPDDERRAKLMPVDRAYPLTELIPAVIQYYRDSGGRRCTFEYIMIKDFNDSIADAKKLYDLIYPTHGFVNLIPLNPVREKGLFRSDEKTIDAFHNYLLSKGVKSTIRKEFGSDIDAACGQLRAKHERK